MEINNGVGATILPVSEKPPKTSRLGVVEGIKGRQATMICRICEIEFDIKDKFRQARLENRPMGRIDECLDCVEEDEVRVTGVMIPTDEGVRSLQINADPKLTQFLNTRRWETTGNTHQHDGGNKPIKIQNTKGKL
jgi:hypothetical protein